jgi:hypothetical protein
MLGRRRASPLILVFAIGARTLAAQAADNGMHIAPRFSAGLGLGKATGRCGCSDPLGGTGGVGAIGVGLDLRRRVAMGIEGTRFWDIAGVGGANSSEFLMLTTRLRVGGPHTAVKIGVGEGGSNDGRTHSVANAPSGVVGFEISSIGRVQGGMFVDLFDSVPTGAQPGASGPPVRYQLFALQAGFTLRADFGR